MASSGVLTFQGRLPGVLCSPALPPPTEAIRLDVAGLVGLAERGPTDHPVALEDVNQYQAIFGGDLVVAQDGGVPVYANLPSAVKAFFENGGRRCHVVRVAGKLARAARWGVPGLRRWSAEGQVAEASVAAAWVGAWASEIQVGTQLLAQPLTIPSQAAYRRRKVPPQAGMPRDGALPVAPAVSLLAQPGDLLRLDLAAPWPSLYVVVGNVTRTGAAWSAATVAEVPFWPAPSLPQDGPVLLERDALDLLPDSVGVRGASLLRFDLVVRRSVDGGIADVVERWSDLCFNPTPSSSKHPFWLDVLQPRAVAPGENRRLLPQPPPDVTRSMNLRAAEDPTGAVYVPFNMDATGGFSEFGEAPEQSLPGTASVPGDDDLSEFHPITLFLDEQLAQATVYDLIPQVDQLTSLAAEPEQLRGIHALATIEEVALIAVPDAVQRGWEPAAPPPAPQPAPIPPSLPAPDWSAFRDCVVPSLPTPPGHKEPDPTAAPRPELISVSSYAEDDLFSIQQALVILCAARGDAVAVLSLPEHYSPAQVVAWRRRVGSSGELSGRPCSFAAVWHPWLGMVEESSPRLAALRQMPPDGAACGTISARELARGVWLAPANVALRGPVSLSRAISPADMASLFDAAANVLVHQPGKFVALSAYTLSTDPRLLQVSVRRLLIMLRKVALRRGARYVFEPNTERFRRLVRTSFERLLTALAQAGAITAFEVVTDGGVNTPNDIANGRFVIVLRVAPTGPVEFITVTLVRDSEGLLDVVET